MRVRKMLFVLLLVWTAINNGQIRSIFITQRPQNSSGVNAERTYQFAGYTIGLACTNNLETAERNGERFLFAEKMQPGRYYYIEPTQACGGFPQLPSVAGVLFKTPHFTLYSLPNPVKSNSIQLRPTEAATLRKFYDGYDFSDSLYIRSVINNVSKDSLYKRIEGMQSFGSRFRMHPNRYQVSEWLKAQYENMGITDVQFDSLFALGIYHRNIIATIPGSEYPDEVIIIGGHWDSVSNPDPIACSPGADNNASGASAAMEIARAFKQAGYIPKRTLQFVAFGAEEGGLYGSMDMAAKYFARGVNVKLVMNFDMIGNATTLNGKYIAEVASPTDYILQLGDTIMQHYSNFATKLSQSTGTDDRSFAEIGGYKTIFYREETLSPLVFTVHDSLVYLDMEYANGIVKSAAAMLLKFDKSVNEVDTVFSDDRGDGHSVRLTWNNIQGSDRFKYIIGVGVLPGEYSRYYTTTDSTIVIDSLVSGVMYFFGVSACNTSGTRSLTTEISSAAFAEPQPLQVNTHPSKEYVRFTWKKAPELDIDGYRVYRSETREGNYTLLNQTTLHDTVYTDVTPDNGNVYWYKICAKDSTGLESFAEPIKARRATLNHGILVVLDNTRGEGILSGHNGQDIKSFYTEALRGFTVQFYNLHELAGITLSDICAFSSVIWLSDSPDTSESEARQLLKEYINLGGNFLYSGSRPSYGFEKNRLPSAVFGSGSYLYDWHRIMATEIKMSSKCNGAVSALVNWPRLNVDSSKTSNTSFHLLNIESVTPVDTTAIIYKYTSGFATGTPQSGAAGKCLGNLVTNGTQNTFLLGLPLFFIQKQDVKAFFRQALYETFGEPVGIENQQADSRIDYELLTNYPNPCNPSTTILYNLPYSSKVRLTVFDAMGREVAILVDEFQQRGNHRVTFNPEHLASGVYMYALQSGGTKLRTNKMILLK